MNDANLTPFLECDGCRHEHADAVVGECDSVGAGSLGLFLAGFRCWSGTVRGPRQLVLPCPAPNPLASLGKPSMKTGKESRDAHRVSPRAGFAFAGQLRDTQNDPQRAG